ncbi:MAG: hypothetical protein KBD40_12360, partial [Phenylobacterium sp.]|nr:hypothetical protein [Phenylobacterium sp.]
MTRVSLSLFSRYFPHGRRILKSWWTITPARGGDQYRRSRDRAVRRLIGDVFAISMRIPCSWPTSGRTSPVDGPP